MKITFREASKQDIALIGELANSIWQRHYIDIITQQQIDYMLKTMYSADSIMQQMNDGHIYTLVFADGIAVGYCDVSTKDNKNYSLHKLYIDPEYHGKAIGSKLFEHILKQLANPESIQLTVNRQNYKAVNFYFRTGFVIKGIADFDIGKGYFMNDFVMVKKIESTANKA